MTNRRRSNPSSLSSGSSVGMDDLHDVLIDMCTIMRGISTTQVNMSLQMTLRDRHMALRDRHMAQFMTQVVSEISGLRQGV